MFLKVFMFQICFLQRVLGLGHKPGYLPGTSTGRFGIMWLVLDHEEMFEASTSYPENKMVYHKIQNIFAKIKKKKPKMYPSADLKLKQKLDHFSRVLKH